MPYRAGGREPVGVAGWEASLGLRAEGITGPVQLTAQLLSLPEVPGSTDA